MDALSAMRVMTSAMSQGQGIAPRESLAAGKIPGQELQKLQTGMPLPQMDKTSQAAPFDNVLGRMVGEVNAKQISAGEAVKGLLSGQGVSMHQAMIAMEEASVSFQLMAEVRNKLLESYQELMRMQI